MTTPADQHTDFSNPRPDVDGGPDDSRDDDRQTVPEPRTETADDTDAATAADSEPQTSTGLGTGTDRDADGEWRANDERAHDDSARPDENGAAYGDADRSAASTATTSSATAASMATTSSDTDADGRERLVSQERADSYGTRWDAVKGSFVDEPREAVKEADKLVGELLDELQELFRSQRQSLEEGLAADETSTEDLRLGLRRYRSFFDRLLSL